MIRCPVHDEVFEEGQKCPRLGDGEHDCAKHNDAKSHEKERVLADGGKWDDKRNKAVEV
jgi:hypothetical protein